MCYVGAMLWSEGMGGIPHTLLHASCTPDMSNGLRKFRLGGGPIGDYLGFWGDLLRDILQI